ncbi:DNA-binding transcriptional LysR family regulator [Mycetocola sp. CAN_C7]|uniref:LysR family transcriptional regulator n=1 Tax=Mycetocola sp. CAN_C7 TaxID=2787724 RepID=UPI0018CB5D78
MDTIALKRFVVAAEELHFAHAAKYLGIPRSTLIASVRSLENELGTPLFDTNASTTTLTAAGRELLAAEQEKAVATAASVQNRPQPAGGKARANKGKGRAPAVKGQPRPGKRRQSR